MERARPGLKQLGFVLCATVVLNGCAARYIRSDGAPAQPPPATSVSRHVLVVSVDGLRPDAIEKFKAPTLLRLMREGSYSLSATTIDPSRTLPSHTSMLTGLTPEQHGVKWNHVITADSDAVGVPTVFSVARDHGYRTAAFFSKAKFHPIQLPGTLDYSQAPGGWFGRWSSDRTLSDVAEYLGTARPNLLFVHIADPDAAGHRNGWMTPQYGKAVLTADAAIAKLIDLADQTFGAGQFSIIVTADHGGHGTGHGSKDPQDVTIPWIAWGRGVRPGALDASPVRTMDTAATVVWLLGIPAQTDWFGRAVLDAYEAGASAATGSRTSARRGGAPDR